MPFVTEHGAYTETIENDSLKWHDHKLAAGTARLARIFCVCDGVTHQSEGPAAERTEERGIRGLMQAQRYS
jgi:hypothetical protein